MLIKSYRDVEKKLNNIPASISEAAQATAATTKFFEPVAVTHGKVRRKFSDAGLGTNNPARMLWNEAQYIWGNGQGIDPQVKCFVSIGTGVPISTKVGTDERSISKTLKAIAAETEKTAREFEGTHGNLLQDKRYFRFNVQQGLQYMKVDDVKDANEIITHTQDYMEGNEVNTKAAECARNLSKKQCEAYFQHAMFCCWRSSR